MLAKQSRKFLFYQKATACQIVLKDDLVYQLQFKFSKDQKKTSPPNPKRASNHLKHCKLKTTGVAYQLNTITKKVNSYTHKKFLKASTTPVALIYRQQICYQPDSLISLETRKVALNNILSLINQKPNLLQPLVTELKKEFTRRNLFYPKVDLFQHIKTWQNFNAVMKRLLQSDEFSQFGISLLLQFNPA